MEKEVFCGAKVKKDPRLSEEWIDKDALKVKKEKWIKS